MYYTRVSLGYTHGETHAGLCLLFLLVISSRYSFLLSICIMKIFSQFTPIFLVLKYFLFNENKHIYQFGSSVAQIHNIKSLSLDNLEDLSPTPSNIKALRSMIVIPSTLLKLHRFYFCKMLFLFTHFNGFRKAIKLMCHFPVLSYSHANIKQL